MNILRSHVVVDGPAPAKASGRLSHQREERSLHETERDQRFKSTSGGHSGRPEPGACYQDPPTQPGLRRHVWDTKPKFLQGIIWAVRFGGKCKTPHSRAESFSSWLWLPRSGCCPARFDPGSNELQTSARPRPRPPWACPSHRGPKGKLNENPFPPVES